MFRLTLIFLVDLRCAPQMCVSCRDRGEGKSIVVIGELNEKNVSGLCYGVIKRSFRWHRTSCNTDATVVCGLYGGIIGVRNRPFLVCCREVLCGCETITPCPDCFKRRSYHGFPVWFPVFSATPPSCPVSGFRKGEFSICDSIYIENNQLLRYIGVEFPGTTHPILKENSPTSEEAGDQSGPVSRNGRFPYYGNHRALYPPSSLQPFPSG